MCAIFGIIGSTNYRLLKKMSLCQLYRGPDAQSFLVNKKNNFSIGMNRLSVIDKKKGKQPMFSHDKKYLVIFNGAIYNFIELRNYLLKKKITFKTNSDTEVIINAYSYWGNKCFNYFDGMWAVGIYDFENKKFIISRDYVGQKPLFYHHDNNKFIFSSQINGIFEYNNKFKIVRNNYEEYLRFGYFHAPNTLYKNIQQVCPGQIIEFKNNKILTKYYWKLENKSNYNLFFKKEKIININNSFNKIIKNFLTADKNVALSLSDGNDSNLLKYLMLKHKNKINSFTIGFKDKTYDETKYIKKDRFNINTKKIVLEKDLIKTFHKFKKKIFFPFGDSSVLPTFELFNLVKKKTNVIVGGDGGDEIFFGYLSFKAFYFANIIKKILPNFLLRLIKHPFSNIKITNDYMNMKKKIKYFFKYLDKDLSLINNYWITNFDDDDYFKYFKKKISSTYQTKKISKLYNKHSDKMRFAQIYYLKFYLPMILTKVDFASMLNSVEARSPYLSKDLLNFTLSHSTKKNFSLLANRKLMKNIFYDFFKNSRKFKKHGFAFNKHLILRNEKLINKNINKNFMINYKFFSIKYKDYLAGNYDNEQYLWNEIILNFSRQNLELPSNK